MSMTRFVDSERFVSTKAVLHNVRTTIHHWQLRDLVRCVDDSREVLYVEQNAVRKLNTGTNRTERVMELNYAPTCMTASKEYLVAGGQNSQLTLMDRLSNRTLFNTGVGGSINNSLLLTPTKSPEKLLISNNDCTLKIFSLPSMTHLHNIDSNVAVNHASVSPDQRFLITLGDTPQVHLRSFGDNNYSPIATFSEAHDSGFSASWSPSGMLFACGFQCGTVCVWDIRSSKPLTKFMSKQSPQVKGAVRAVKFAPTRTIDLLCFIEHLSYLHVIDTRSLCKRQVVRVAPPQREQHLSGLSFSPESSRIFVGLEDCIVEYTVEKKLRRAFPHVSLA
eukprot:GCRY01005527.1.p1 GENE.GCRY01005527.1~~GCRY01005527.1.p1  ORF type:complete len:334 (-),score=43.57 GCRY01005527.1:932-1933(-)